MKAYPNDLRRQIAVAYERKRGSQREIAEQFGVCQATVRNIIRRRRETGSSEAFRCPGGKSPRLGEASVSLVRELLAASDKVTLSELCSAVTREHGLRVSLATMCRVRKRLDASLVSRRQARS